MLWDMARMNYIDFDLHLVVLIMDLFYSLAVARGIMYLSSSLALRGGRLTTFRHVCVG
jgi:hypothetical protein